MKLLLFFIFISGSAFASSTTSKQIDTITNSTGGTSLSVPSTGSNILSDSASQTVTNKTISGSSNTLSNLPVSVQYNQDLFFGNGSGTAFTMTATPASTNGVTVYLDGQLLTAGASYDYTISGAVITMTTAPATGQSVLAVYSKY